MGTYGKFEQKPCEYIMGGIRRVEWTVRKNFPGDGDRNCGGKQGTDVKKGDDRWNGPSK